MKRVKRDPAKRAYKQGINSGRKGLEKESCPYHNGEKKDQWLGGWRVGHADRVAGFRQNFEDMR